MEDSLMIRSLRPGMIFLFVCGVASCKTTPSGVLSPGSSPVGLQVEYFSTPELEEEFSQLDPDWTISEPYPQEVYTAYYLEAESPVQWVALEFHKESPLASQVLAQQVAGQFGIEVSDTMVGTLAKHGGTTSQVLVVPESIFDRRSYTELRQRGLTRVQRARFSEFVKKFAKAQSALFEAKGWFFTGLVDEAAVYWEPQRKDWVLHRNIILGSRESLLDYVNYAERHFPNDPNKVLYAESVRKMLDHLGDGVDGAGAIGVPGEGVFLEQSKLATDVIVVPDAEVNVGIPVVGDQNLPVAQIVDPHSVQDIDGMCR